MSSKPRRPKLVSPRRNLAIHDQSYGRDLRPYKTITLSVPLPLPVALRARREIYTYPYPMQKRLHGRTIRKVIPRSSRRYVMTKVRVRVPARLPLTRGSYVSISRGRLNIHSRKQLAAAVSRGETNRRRYQEAKRNRRKASHGQLDSPRALQYGIVSRLVKQGASASRIADGALVARALYNRWRR